MIEFLKEVIADSKSKSPSAHRYVTVISAISLCVGFLASVVGLYFGAVESEVPIALGGILAALGGGTYTANKAYSNEKGAE